MNYEESGSGFSSKILEEFFWIQNFGISCLGASTRFCTNQNLSQDNGYVTIPVYITVCQVTQVIAALLGRIFRTVCQLRTTLNFRCSIEWDFIWSHPFRKWLQA